MLPRTNQRVDDANQSDKANWDQELTKAFVDVCVERVKAGDKPNTHFTRDGWKKVIADFLQKTGKSYDQGQLKNKWDNLKRDCRIWEKLILGETGISFDRVRGCINADNDWWERKIRQDNRVKKFRHHAIENEDGLRVLFGGQGATGAYAMNPSARRTMLEGGDEGRDNLELSLSDNSSESDPPYDASADPDLSVHSTPSPPPTTRRTTSKSSTRRKGRKRAYETREEISNSLDKLVSVVSSRTGTSTPAADPNSIELCYKRLEELPETSVGGPLLMYAFKLFEKKENRMIFSGIKRADWQVDWLKMKYEEGSGATSS